jgi:hypothetical protein
MTDPFQTVTARPVEPGPAVRRSERRHEATDRATGWLVFAAIIVGVTGALNAILGIAAISNSSFYLRDAKYALGDLETYGWIVLLIGAVQMCASLGILAWATWARWVGVVCATAGAIVQFLFIPAYPLLAITLYAVDLLVIYGLVAYGGRRAAD